MAFMLEDICENRIPARQIIRASTSFMTLPSLRRATALTLIILLIGSTFTHAAYAADAAPSTDAATAPAATDTSSSDSTDTSATAATAPSDASDSTSDSSSSDTGAAQQSTATQSDASTTDVSDTVSASDTSASSSEADTQTSVTATGTGDMDASTTPALPDLPTDDTPASTSSDDVASTGGTLATTTLPDVPAVPSGDSIATTSSSVAATTTSAVASTTIPFQIPFADAASTTASTTPTIQSGEAVAVANILNIVNTNIVNSQGAVVLGNYFDPENGTIDLRSSNPFGALACNLLSCNTGGITVNVGDNASIDNAVALSADTGGNAITSNTDGTINTGNAFAGLNLVNLANTNIVDSNYLLVTLNAFQGVNGDIVFPSLTNFLNQLANAGGSGSFSVDPSADVQNNVSATADSGGNSTDAASSTIATGSALSAGNVFNRINTASLGGGNVSILFRVQGNWTGQIFGAPAGLNWTQGSDGSILLFGAPSLSAGSGADLSDTAITGSSTAKINNNVTVAALTGANHIATDGSALITTGNALASANVVNVANTDVVGKNWILAVVNIFGNFTGNIAFGRPDLWVGEQVSVPSFIQNGTDVTYKYTVINNGDSDATNAMLTDTQDMTHMSIASSSVPYSVDSAGHMVWQLGTIPAGQAMEVSYDAQVQDTQPGTPITDSVSVGEHETDNNIADNTDTATIAASASPSGGLESASARFAPDAVASVNDIAQPDLSAIRVERDTATATLTRGERAHETLTIRNNGTNASPALALDDILRDPSGTMIQDQSGSIGVLQPGDAVTIDYDLAFAADAPAGRYTLSTVVDSGDMSAMASDNGTLILKGAAAAPGVPTNHASKQSLAATIAGSLVTHIAHASTGNLGAAAAAAGISWQLALFLFLIAAIAAGAGLTAYRLRKRA